MCRRRSSCGLRQAAAGAGVIRFWPHVAVRQRRRSQSPALPAQQTERRRHRHTRGGRSASRHVRTTAPRCRDALCRARHPCRPRTLPANTQARRARLRASGGQHGDSYAPRCTRRCGSSIPDFRQRFWARTRTARPAYTSHDAGAALSARCWRETVGHRSPRERLSLHPVQTLENGR